MAGPLGSPCSRVAGWPVAGPPATGFPAPGPPAPGSAATGPAATCPAGGVEIGGCASDAGEFTSSPVALSGDGGGTGAPPPVSHGGAAGTRLWSNVTSVLAIPGVQPHGPIPDDTTGSEKIRNRLLSEWLRREHGGNSTVLDDREYDSVLHAETTVGGERRVAAPQGALPDRAALIREQFLGDLLAAPDGVEELCRVVADRE